MSHPELTHEDWVDELKAQLAQHPKSQLIISDDEGPPSDNKNYQEYEIVDCQSMPDNTIRLTITKV